VTDAEFVRVREHVFPRQKGLMVGVVIGTLIGIGNAAIGLVLPDWLPLVGLLVGAILFVLILHEGLHGLVGWLFGHRPIFGVQPPLVFTTFDVRIPRGHFIAVALAPLVVLDAVFVTAYLLDVFPVFANLCFAVNTMGAVGDVWIVWRLLGHERGTWVQDTKSGVEVWKPAS
jgi:hypothetical protein